jgi:hypothetical protein
MQEINLPYWVSRDDAKKIRKFQEELSGMPLVPHDARLRSKRARISSQLIELARKNNCLAQVTVLCGRID